MVIYDGILRSQGVPILRRLGCFWCKFNPLYLPWICSDELGPAWEVVCLVEIRLGLGRNLTTYDRQHILRQVSKKLVLGEIKYLITFDDGHFRQKLHVQS